MTDLVIPAAPAVVTVPDVELCAVGTWKIATGETTFTYEDLAACVAALDCPGVRNPVLKLGHAEEDGPNVRWDGEPAVGWVANMRLIDDGAKLAGDFAGMPSWLADILPSAYPDRSVELYQPFLCQIGHLHPAAIGAVALLGVMPPGVGVLQSLQDVAALYGVTAAAAVQSPVRTVAVRFDGRLALAAADTTVLRRELTKVEAAAQTDFEAIQADWQDALDVLLAGWVGITAAQRQALVDQVAAAVDAGQVDQLAELAADSDAAATLLAEQMQQAAEDAAAEMVREAKRQGVDVDAGAVDTARLGDMAKATASLLASGLAGAAGRRATQVATPTAVGADVAATVAEHLESLSETFLRDQLGGALSAAQNAGRLAVLDAAPAAEYVASEVLDAATCPPCAAVDGQRFASVDEAQAAYANGGYVDCEGFLRCRGIVVAVWGDTSAASSPVEGPHRPPRTVTALRIEGSGHAHEGHRICFVG